MDKKNLIISIMFNVVEILCVMAIGIALNISLSNIIIILFVFVLTRLSLGNALHFKKWYLCFIWTTLMFVSLFFIFNADIFVSILSTIFTGYITCGKSNIVETFLFKKESKYKLLDDFIQYNYDHSELARYENHLFNTDKLKYRLFILRFRKNCTWDVIEEQTGITDRKRLNSMLDSMYDTLSYNLMLEI